MEAYPKLFRTDADITLVFLENYVVYTNPVSDPWFKAIRSSKGGRYVCQDFVKSILPLQSIAHLLSRLATKLLLFSVATATR
jgi:hypothetical protein